MSAININDDTFETEVLHASKPVLVDFWAPWCGPCRMMGPIVDELADEIESDAVVVKVNVDEAPNTAAKYAIQSIPAFVVIKDGEIVDQLSGVLPKETLRTAVTA